jgi:hypothetical protein
MRQARWYALASAAALLVILMLLGYLADAFLFGARVQPVFEHGLGASPAAMMAPASQGRRQ